VDCGVVGCVWDISKEAMLSRGAPPKLGGEIFSQGIIHPTFNDQLQTPAVTQRASRQNIPFHCKWNMRCSHATLFCFCLGPSSLSLASSCGGGLGRRHVLLEYARSVTDWILTVNSQQILGKSVTTVDGFYRTSQLRFQPWTSRMIHPQKALRPSGCKGLLSSVLCQNVASVDIRCARA
jgi:hypothetical protein